MISLIVLGISGLATIALILTEEFLVALLLALFFIASFIWFIWEVKKAKDPLMFSAVMASESEEKASNSLNLGD